ncbi:MAG TPA: hypothetical protein DCP69_01615 [Candidatus Omnitrophica bacterium]|nr:hypothetical protein [Candidatus Omnitrophota bacterium]
MATLANPRKFRYGLGHGQYRIWPEAATCVAKRGEPVLLSSGKIARCTTTATSLTSGTGVAGWAMADASGTTDADIVVLMANDSTEWLIPVIHGTAASAVTAVTNVGTQYCISHLTTGGWYGYEISVTTNPVIEVTELCAEYAAGEQYGTAWVKIATTAMAAGGIA